MEATKFFGKERVTLFHGSSKQVRHPEFGVGNPHNDYGLGFYTTELQNLAFEWACPVIDDGWVNEYTLDVRELSILDLSGPECNVLNWMAVLLEHRRINLGVGIAAEAREYLIQHYGVNLTSADIVHGYRADDSYFHIARAFLNNRIPMEVLEQSLYLGGLGYQVVIMSEKTFDNLTWITAEPAHGRTWHPRRIRRDSDARATAAELEREAVSTRTGCYILDIMRGVDPWRR